jgi:hypothetical protein
MTSQLAAVGSTAPAFPLCELTAITDGRPRVIAFLHGWSLGDESVQRVHAIRARVTELEAEVIVLSGSGVWSFRPEDETARDSEQLVGEVAAAAMLFGVRPAGDAVFVLDGRGIIRFAFRCDEPTTARLAEALDAAAETLAARESHGKLARVLFTRREWAMAALVVGCSLTFCGDVLTDKPRRDARREVIDRARERVDRRRLARGSGPLPTMSVAGPPRPRIALLPLPRPPLSPASRKKP